MTQPESVERSVVKRALSKGLQSLAPLKDAEVPLAPPTQGGTWEIRLLAIVSLGVYGFVGWWLRHYLHFAVGDALARTANAKYMLFARHAHFAALGFVWMPIPTVSQIPAMLIAEPLGYAADAGWVTTAVWGAITVWVLGRMCRDLGLPRITTLLLVIAYAFNPVIVYYAANGMSEGPLFTFVAITFWGLLRYLERDRGDTNALILTAVGLTGCALDRYEAIPLIFATGAFLLVHDLRRTGRRSAVLATVLTTLPAMTSVAIWFLYMRIIKGTFRAFINDAAGNQVAQPAPGAPASTTVPAPTTNLNYKDIVNGMDWLHYTVHWCFAFAPAIVLIPVLLLPPLRRSFAAITLLTFAIWLPGVTAYLLRFGGSAGDPRYFTSVIISATIAVIFGARRLNIRWLRLVVHPLLIAALGLGWFTGAHAQLDQASTKQEGESRVFDVLQGNVDRSDTRQIVAWAAFSKHLDAVLQPHQIVFVDVRFSFEAELYSQKPQQFIINNDADFDSIRSNPYRQGVRIDYLLVSPPGSRGDGVDYAQTILNDDPTAWRPLASPGPDLLYERVTGTTGPAPAVGVEGDGSNG